MLDMYDFANDIWLCHSFRGQCFNFTAFVIHLPIFYLFALEINLLSLFFFSLQFILSFEALSYEYYVVLSNLQSIH